MSKKRTIITLGLALFALALSFAVPPIALKYGAPESPVSEETQELMKGPGDVIIVSSPAKVPDYFTGTVILANSIDVMISFVPGDAYGFGLSCEGLEEDSPYHSHWGNPVDTLKEMAPLCVGLDEFMLIYRVGPERDSCPPSMNEF